LSGRPIMRATWPAHTLPKLPEGTVKLTFLNKSTRFENLSAAADPF